jgi:transposase InsO family protein
MANVAERPRRKRLSWEMRSEIVAKVRDQGMAVSRVAATSGVHRSTVYRLLARFDAGGWSALRDRSSRPRRHPRRLDEHAEAEICALRERTRYGPRRIAALCGRPASTVGKVLRRCGISRLPRPPRPEVLRYERERPGELLHLDTKRLGRFHHVGKRILNDGVQRSPRAGWQHLHVAIDDHSRLAYAEVLDGQGKEHCSAFLRRAVAWFADQGIAIERVITDNGHGYRSKLFLEACAELGIAAKKIRPYRPQTNGKAEALIGTALREWAYRYAYPSSRHRTRALWGWLRWYNRRRPHTALGDRPPISRVAQDRGYFT